MIDDFVDCGQQQQQEKEQQQQQHQDKNEKEVEKKKIETKQTCGAKEKDDAFIQVLRNQEQLIEDLVYRELVNVVYGDETFDLYETCFGIYLQELFNIFYFEVMDANSDVERAAECRRQRNALLDLVDECRNVKNTSLHLILSKELQRNLEEERRSVGIE